VQASSSARSGAPAEAVPLLERARTLRESASSLPEELGEVRFALARALRAAPPAERSRSLRARPVAPREGFASLPNRGRELAEIDAWLASHR
jgi:hypothetical protein